MAIGMVRACCSSPNGDMPTSTQLPRPLAEREPRWGDPEGDRGALGGVDQGIVPRSIARIVPSTTPAGRATQRPSDARCVPRAPDL